jgi:hypothetical protein
MKLGYVAPAVLAGLVLAAAGSARAADEEIQVYMDEMSKAGHFGLDLHNNYVVSGDRTPDHFGGEPSAHTYRFTPEFAYGITDNLEAGLYILSTVDPRGTLTTGGEKLRLKWIAPKAQGQDWFWGLNFEIGKVSRRYDVNPWNAELKGIAGFRKGPWTVAANLNLDWAISGPAVSPASLDFDTKISYALSEKFALGIETYNGLGDVKALGRFSDADEIAYLVADTSIGKWDLNLGVGRGYSTPTDKWVLKAIVGVPFE